MAFSYDPGDMLTEMHKKALPDDDPACLKAPAQSVRELVEKIESKSE